MASQAPAAPSSADTPITIKLALDGSNRRFKLPLKDLGIAVFSTKIAKALAIPDDKVLSLERYSDSSGGFVPVDATNPSSYKQLYRAAKAKQKLRFRANIIDKPLKKNNHSIPSTVSNGAPIQPEIAPAVTSPRESPAAFKAINSAPVPDGRELQRRALELVASLPKAVHPTGRSYQVCCNNCDRVMPDAHFHCSICDNGDFDLCESCVNSGIVCNGEGHWLLKRFVKNGAVVNSTTERVAPKTRPSPPAASAKPSPSAVSAPSVPSTQAVNTTPAQDLHEDKRTCNACVRTLPERIMITCNDCPDFDICMPCHVENKHGHHPGHALQSISSSLPMPPLATALCNPGRNLRHNAICDACDKTIYGVRHKCLNCPDFDFCNSCIDGGRRSHQHRFVKVFEPLESPAKPSVRHFGVYCDGPMCNMPNRRRSYISGVRYKCAVCDDFDLCACCESHPSNSHNKTHPMIKFKTMVRDVSVTTHTDDHPSGATKVLGDRAAAPAVAESVRGQLVKSEAPPVGILDATLPLGEIVSFDSLNAHFRSETVPDGTSFSADDVFTQAWTLVNPGPSTWPAGCNVRLVGGDDMLNVPAERAVSTEELSAARETNGNPTAVAPGQSFDFTVTLKAPSRVGRHISYWRLKAPDGTPFGHKLWCDVNVKESSTRQTISEKEPEEDKSDRLMVFPRLEKESPAASTHEDLSPAAGASLAPSVALEQAETLEAEEEEIEVDAESVEFSDADVDDGFYTDEEYDILDASDEELQSNGHAAV